jgi:hypothetical protein
MGQQALFNRLQKVLKWLLARWWKGERGLVHVSERSFGFVKREGGPQGFYQRLPVLLCGEGDGLACGLGSFRKPAHLGVGGG